MAESISSQATQTKGGSEKTKTKSVTSSESSSNVVISTEVVFVSREEFRDGEVKVNGSEPSGESAFVRELQKNIRNVSKKLSAMQKVDTVMSENPNMSLDELVAARKINNDQKAQALKKPSLQASLAQFEDQITQYKKIEEEFQTRARGESDQLQQSHQKELEDLRTSLRAEAASGADKDLRGQLLTLSQFLRAAAARRQLEDDDSEESKAFEGLLLLLYGGDESAVDAAEKLIKGSSEGVTSTEGTDLEVSFERIKQMSVEYAPFPAETSWAKDAADAEPPAEQSATTDDSTSAPPEPTALPEITIPAHESVESYGADPTITNAGMTEIDAGDTVQASEPVQEEVSNSIEATTVDTGAANTTAANQWERETAAASDPMGESWVAVPRDPTETEQVLAGGAPGTTQNWADELPEPKIEQTTQPTTDDGFHEVHHSHGGRGRGGHRGHEGRGNGRGRGGHRGGEGGHRGRGGVRGDRGEAGGRGRGRGGHGRGGRGRGESS